MIASGWSPRRSVRATLAGAALGASYWAVAASFTPPVRRGLARHVLSRIRTDVPEVALTFDDGPDPALTERFLGALDGAHATFFWLGERVRRWPALAAQAVALGHELACHGDDHRSLARLGPRATVDSLRLGRDAIAAATGAAPGFYRPPYGVFNLAAWIAAPRLGMRRTLWSRWARDWEARATPRLIADRIVGGATPGAILLLHDADGDPGAPERTLRALPWILDGLDARGLRPVGLSRLVANEGGA